MNGFSTLSKGVIKDFARDMGVDARGLEEGSVSFVLSRSGLLSFTSSQDGTRVLISLARQPRFAQEATELAFLSRAGFDAAENKLLHAGLSEDGWLVGSVSLDERDFDAPTTETTIQRLSRMLDESDAR